MKTIQKLNSFQFCKTIPKKIQVHCQKWGQLATKSPRYESLKKFDNTKFVGVWLWNKGAPLAIWDLHHEGVGLISNIRMTHGAIICSFVRFEVRKTHSCTMLWIQWKEKNLQSKSTWGWVCERLGPSKYVIEIYR